MTRINLFSLTKF